MENEIIKPAKFKLEEFNNCLGIDEVKKMMKDLGLTTIYAVDVDPEHLEFWQNDHATMVFSTVDTTPNTFLMIGRLAVEMRADEMHHRYIQTKGERKLIIRLWWD